MCIRDRHRRGKQRLQSPFFGTDVWVKSKSNRNCLSQIWVKKIRKSAYLRHISFRDKSARLFKIWIRKKTIGKEHIFAIRIIPSTPNFQYGRVCLFAMYFMRLQLEEKGISGLSYFKLTLLAKGTDVCQMSVILNWKNSDIWTNSDNLSPLEPLATLDSQFYHQDRKPLSSR